MKAPSLKYSVATWCGKKMGERIQTVERILLSPATSITPESMCEFNSVGFWE